MQLTLADVVGVLEDLYPPHTAQSWDRVGLVAGDPTQPVGRVHFAVDPTMAVIEEARALGADLLVTHHPLLLRGVHSVATTSLSSRSSLSEVATPPASAGRAATRSATKMGALRER